MLFEVNFIQVPTNLTPSEEKKLDVNCTHVKGPYWIFEGELWCLDCRLILIDTGVVGCLGDLSQAELIEVCKNAFEFDHSILDNV